MIDREQLRQQLLQRHLTVGRRPPQRKRLPRQVQPETVRVAYFAALRDQVTKPAAELVHQVLVPELEHLLASAAAERGDSLHLDIAAHDRIAKLVGSIRTAFARSTTVSTIKAVAAKFAQRTSDFQREQLKRQLKTGLGVDPIFHEPGLQARVDGFVAENVALIQSVPTQYFDQVEQVVQRGVRQGMRADELADELVERAGVSESRAKLIARDQVGKFNGELNKTRQESLGISGYTWETMNDGRVRDEHEELQGQHFDWDDPPDEGHPGEAVNCRCYASPDLESLQDDDDSDE